LKTLRFPNLRMRRLSLLGYPGAAKICQ